MITSSPTARQIRISDPSYTRLISSLMSTKLDYVEITYAEKQAAQITT